MNNLLTAIGIMFCVVLGIVLLYIVARVISLAIFQSYVQTIKFNGGNHEKKQQKI